MKKIFLFTLIFSPCVVLAQLDRSIVPPATPAKEISIPDPVVFKTDNGITVILSENHKLPRVMFDLRVGTGQQLEGNKTGVMELASELILSGTSTYTKDEFDAKKDYIGASLWASYNQLSLRCLTKHMDTGLELFSDVLYNANFPQNEFDRIVKKTQSELLSVQSSAEAMGDNALMSIMFEKHPYGEVMTEQTLSNISREDVEQYFKKTFVPDQSYLVVVGDITQEKVEKVVEKYFSSWTGTAQQKVEYSTPKKPSENRVVFVKKTGAVQSYIQVATPVDIKMGDANYIPMMVTNGILGGGGFGNRLVMNLREDKAYTYGAYSYLDVDSQGAFFNAAGSFRNEVTDSAITELLYELDRITDSYVTDEEMKMTKSIMTGRFARSLEEPATIARFALNIERYKLDKNYYKNYLKNLEAVTKEQILEKAQQFLAPKNYYIVVVGNEEVIDKIKNFDSDGIIEMLDAFGQPIKDRKQADISANELFKRHSLYVTNSKTEKDRNKAIKKLKSYKQEIEMSMDQIPFPLNMTIFWGKPNSEVVSMEAQGMVFVKTYFDGKTGYISNMQTGKQEMSEQQISAKNKDDGFVPEINYDKTAMEYELLGIEEADGRDVYVVKLNDGHNERYVYYDAQTYCKLKQLSILSDPDSGETQEQTMIYDDYRLVGGIMLPHKIVLSMGPVAFNGIVKTTTINKGTISDFK